MKKYVLKYSKLSIIALQCMLVVSTYSCNTTTAQQSRTRHPDPAPVIRKKTKIQVALLLDTSNSMDGLIDQAKSRLWNIINTLSTLRYQGSQPDLEIALYEYGNDGLSASEGHIRQVTPFTTDLDLLSEKLFALRTYGGLEYCGQVIQSATRQLTWDRNDHSMKLIYIAGNEPFSQGKVHYAEAIASAVSNNIYVNTIYCGDYRSGIQEEWKTGADKGKGKYFNIDHNKEIRYVETPYDRELEVLNERLNRTYYGYGRLGSEYKSKQVAQDRNATMMNKAVQAERTVSKSKTNYHNAQWDMVDAYKADSKFVAKVKEEELPSEFKNISRQELERKIVALEKERKVIQADIDKVSRQRAAFIEQQSQSVGDGDDLGRAITTSILDLAARHNYSRVQ